MLIDVDLPTTVVSHDDDDGEWVDENGFAIHVEVSLDFLFFFLVFFDFFDGVLL